MTVPVFRRTHCRMSSSPSSAPSPSAVAPVSGSRSRTASSRSTAATWSSRAAQRAAPAGSPMIVTGEGRIALVVEDEASVLDLIVTILSQTGWRVDVATGGREGLELVRNQRYELIVSDIRMPDGDGESFYRSATQDDPALGQRFIFITGDTANRDAFTFLKDAGVLILEKPFQPTFFLDAVRRVTS